MRPVSRNTRDQNTFTEEPDKIGQAETSNFDLSHAHISTSSMGQLVPIACYETMPGDYFRLGHQIMTRFAALFLPLMHKIDFYVSYFYVPNRNLWNSPNGWAEFISRKTELEAPYIMHPQIRLGGYGPPATIPDNAIAEYMGFPTLIEDPGMAWPSLKISALPVSAYWKIWDQYYRNPQIQLEKWENLDVGDNSAKFYAGADFTKLKVGRKNWSRDYFTSALPEPQVGEDILVPMYNPDYNDPDGFNDNQRDWIRGPYIWREMFNHNPPINASDLETRTNLSFPSMDGQTANEAGELLYLDIQSPAATLRQFRMAARLLEFNEQLMRVGNTRYSDFIEGMFRGVNPDKGVVQVPEFIGSTKGTVIISEVLATAESINDLNQVTMPVGGYGGQALSMERSETFSYYCTEHGYIMALLAITPKSSYMQGLAKMWTRENPLDWPHEKFAEIGDQAILKEELLTTVTNDDPVDQNTTNKETWAYIPRYDEMRFKNDIVSGEMRNLWPSFHLGRIFPQIAGGGVDQSSAPPLNEFFVECRPRITDVFQLGGAQRHETFMHIWNSCEVKRQLPRSGIPKL